MNVEFRKSFEKDLRKIKDEAALPRIAAVIEEVENADSLGDISNIKKLQAEGDYYRISDRSVRSKGFSLFLRTKVLTTNLKLFTLFH
ncbi:MAG TPA: hypothetical protein V6D25_05810 [Leptolyngbyaceae cyanobacterium]